MHRPPSSLRWADRAAMGAGGFSLALGIGALTGWLLNISALKSVLDGRNMMKANTALGFVLSGLALLACGLDRPGCGTTPRSKPIYRLFATAILAIGAATLFEHVTGSNLGIDEILFDVSPDDDPFANQGRMSPLAAINFVLIGFALWFIHFPRLRNLSAAFSLLPALGGLIVLTAYIYGAALPDPFRQMAVHTAIGFVVVGFGIHCLCADAGLMGLLTADGAAGKISRQLFPAAIVIPIVVGWFRLRGQRLGWYDTELGLVIYAVTTVLMFSLLIFVGAKRLHRSEQALDIAAETRNRLSAIVATSDDAIISKTLEGIITSWNYGAEQIFGYTEEEAIGRPMLMLIPEDRIHEETDILRRIGHGEAVEHFETVRVCKDGTLIDVSTTISPLRDSGGKVIGASKIARDVTEKKNAELRMQARLQQMLDERTAGLEAANRELEAFCYSVSHDLRQPLRSVVGYSSMLVEDYEPHLDAEGKRLIAQIQNSSQRMGMLIDDLLEFSRISRQVIKDTPVGMEMLAKASAADLHAQAEQHHTELTIESLPHCYGDASLLRLAWINLLTNAIKFSRNASPPRIVVSARSTDDENVYCVADNGVGFNMSYYGKLFGVFQRLHDAREFEGTGVGLAIVHRVVTRHGGRVWAESEEGRGAKFYFSLPKRAKASAP